MLQVDRDLADIRLKEADGDEVRLGDLWAGQTVALIWLRHFR